MLINATDTDEIRVAILAEGVLSDFDIEFIHNEKIKGNIYKARVIRVDTSLQAAFVHYGGQKNGFLPIAELPKDMVSPDGRRGRIQDLLQRDQEIMVQAIREELGTKGAMVTAQISLPGRYLVLTPGSAINGISRKIESSEEREHFKGLVDGLDVPQGMGVIVRTASSGVTKEDFGRDLGNLLDSYKEILALYEKRVGAGLVWQEDDVVTRTLRDSWTPEIEEIHIDDMKTFRSAQRFFRRTMPQHLGALHPYTGKKPIFSKFQTEEQIDRIFARRVPLPSGGIIALDQTEALVAIDVNSGRTAGDNQEDTALRTNLEAAEAIACQLRLRDMAGLIVIDFIDMRRETNNKAVVDRLVECLRADKARMEVGKINRFGVLVMTRQRIRPSIQHVTHETCPVCLGTGQVKNAEALIISAMRRVKSVLSRNSLAKLQIRLSPATAINLLNQRRAELAGLETAYGTPILVTPDQDIAYGEISLELTRKEDAAELSKQLAEPEKQGRKRDPENETVVLEGEAPISFVKALPQAAEKGQGSRRASQRAALDERERLRSLFETPAPKKESAPKIEAHKPPKGRPAPSKPAVDAEPAQKELQIGKAAEKTKAAKQPRNEAKAKSPAKGMGKKQSTGAAGQKPASAIAPPEAGGKPKSKKPAPQKKPARGSAAQKKEIV
jgi:ribonuclease E